MKRLAILLFVVFNINGLAAPAGAALPQRYGPPTHADARLMASRTGTDAVDAVHYRSYRDGTPGMIRRSLEYGTCSEPVYNVSPVQHGEIGDTSHFFYDERAINAVLLAKGDHCAVYVKGQDSIDPELPARIVAEFDRTVYPSTLELFGANSWPGQAVSILLIPSSAQNISGFVSPLDGFPKSHCRYSNEAPLVTIELPSKINEGDLWHLLSTQFAYLLSMTLDPDEQIWLRSGICHFAGFFNGYGHPQDLETFFITPTGVSLTDWMSEPSPAQAGAAYAFVHYLVDHAANRDPRRVIPALASEQQDGIQGVEAAMSSLGSSVAFEKLFRRWCSTNAVNSQAGQNERYGYRHIKGTVALADGGSLIGLSGPIHKNLPRWSAAYIGFEQSSHWQPDLPTIHDQITFVYDRPGTLVWGVDGWKLPPQEYWPDGSSQTSYNGRPAVGTPLVDSAVEGLFQAVVGPFKHVSKVNKMDFTVVFDDGDKAPEHSIPISHDQNLSLPAVAVEFRGESGMFSSKKKFGLDLALRSDDGDGQVKKLDLSSGNKYKGVLGQFGVYYTRMVLVPTNLSARLSAASSLEFTLKTSLQKADRDFERSLHLQVKIYKEATELYKKIVAGLTDAQAKRRYMLLSSQFGVLTDELLEMLGNDLEYKQFNNFETLERFAYNLPRQTVQALRAVIDKAIPLVRAKIKQENASGVTPDVELDLLLFKLSNLRAYVYEAGEVQTGDGWDDDINGGHHEGDDDDDDDDDDIISPITDEDYLTVVQESVDYLSDVPIDAVLARDVLEKILGQFIITANDEITEFLKAFGLNIDIDFTHLPFNYILNLVKLKSYTQTTQQSLLEQWSAGMNEEDRESLKRLYLSQQCVVTGFKSSLVMADDATEGLYDVVDLALGACKATDHVLSTLEHVPIVGKWAKKLKVKIIQRIVYALNNAVQFVTQKLKEPWRSRVAAVCNAATTIYIKWKDIEIDEGFGGINAKLFAKIGVKVLGKTLLIMPPKIGYVAMTQKTSDKGANLAVNHDYYGTYQEATRKVIDDLDPDTENAVLERVVKTTARKQKLSLQERQIANFAGCASQVAQYMHLLDPSGITKIVSIVAGAFAGGLQLHSVFNSIHYFYKLPKEIERGVILAFEPGAEVDSPRLTIDDIPFVRINTRSTAVRAVSRAVDAYGQSLDRLRDLAEQEKVAGINNELSSFEDASFGFRKGLKMMALADFGTRDEDVDFVSQALMKENFSSADLFSKALEFSFKPDDRRKKRALIRQIDLIKEQVNRAGARMNKALRAAGIREIARLDHMSRAAMQDEDTLEIRVLVLSTGALPARNVRCSLVVPTNYEIVSPARVTVGSIPAQGEVEVSWTVQRKNRRTEHQCFTFNIESDNAGSTNGIVYLAKKRDGE